MSQWIARLVKERYKTVAALSKAIGMTESGFSRAAKAGTFDVENCLRLADETGESAAYVLTLARKAEINALIERLYGSARAPRHPDAEKAAEMMAAILDDQAREGFLMMMRGFLNAQKAASRTAEAAPAKPIARHR